MSDLFGPAAGYEPDDDSLYDDYKDGYCGPNGEYVEPPIDEPEYER